MTYLWICKPLMPTFPMVTARKILLFLTPIQTLTDQCINVGAPVCVQFLTGR